jgi:LmbE family N-acetylglucosaminyl deacetylase
VSESGMRTSHLLLSPHFDDAVMSSGHWLVRHPGCTVAIVGSGRPGLGVPACQWDSTSGYSSGDAASLGRRDEDASALGVLGCQQHLLGFLDGEYQKEVGRSHEDPNRSGDFEAELTRTLEELYTRMQPEQFIAPLGLAHEDHKTTGRAARAVLRNHPECTLLVYADLPYAITDPTAVTGLLDDLRLEGFRVMDYHLASPNETDCESKRVAVDCYATQHRQLDVAHPRWRDCLNPGAEHFFRIRVKE